ncbi:MAG: 50S ribosomal protein L1 [Chloroflexota bacterium]|nr:50S ribosomal protein L1 [Chloroflexota bacterium]NOG65797.1 50S ribosomal protein L1 [Chloroflexota bacterium]GIK67111.1 MAG: 50S ribosomal protein L1 [Chloroflexota bacterium]
MSHGKNYAGALAKVDRDKNYSPEEAIALIKQVAFAKFDETVEVHARLGIDPRQSDQQVRSTVLLPHGLGKTVRILVFAEGEAVQIAKDAGADIIADDDIITQIERDGWVEFDTAIAIPAVMRKIGKLGKVLGRRNLMPSPKSGTVVAPEDLAGAIQEARAGKLAYRNDKTGNIHAPIGKIRFEEQQLVENLAALMDSLRRNKPASAKGTYLKRLVVTSTMGPGVRVDPNLALAMGITVAP